MVKIVVDLHGREANKSYWWNSIVMAVHLKLLCALFTAVFFNIHA